MISNPNKFGVQLPQDEQDIERENLYDQMRASELGIGFGVAEGSRAAFEEGWITSLGTIGRYALGVDETGDELTPDQVAEQFDGMKVGSNMHYGEAARLSNQRDNRAYADFVMQNMDESALGSTALPFLAGLAGNIADPTTLLLGGAAVAATTTGLPAVAGVVGGSAAAGVASSAASIFIASSLLEWGVEELLYHAYYEDMFNEEYTAQDSAMNLIAAFTLGGIIEFGSGSMKSLWNKGSTKTKELIANYQANTHASGRKTDLVTLEKTIWEDVWNGKTSKNNVPVNLNEIHMVPFHGVKMIEGPSKGSGDKFDMDTNHSRDASVYTNDEGMAAKAASDNEGNKVTIQAKPGTRVLDLDNPEPGILEGVASLLPDDGMSGQVYKDMTLKDIMNFLNTPTQNAEINMKRQKALHAIDDYIKEQGYAGTIKGGGQIHGDNFNGQYEHTALTVYDKDAFIETDNGKVPPNNGKRVVGRKVKGQEVYDKMNSPEAQKGYDPEMESHIDDMADEFEALDGKAPDDPSPEKIKVFEEDHYAKLTEEGQRLTEQIETFKQNPNLDQKFIQKMERKLEMHTKNHKDWSPEAREKIDPARREYDVCMMGGA